MARERRKIIQAGRLWMAVQYTAIRGGSQRGRREARSQISTPARESLNARYSWQKLMLTLAANFVSTDMVVTLTYREETLPVTREAADRNLSALIRKLRAHRKEAGQPLRYVRVTEGYHSGGRLHHHLILNSTGEDYALLRRLWARHGDNIQVDAFGADGFERWSRYLTKEPREQGRRYVGDRTWRASIHMKKPVVTCEYVDGSDRLEAPAGAFITDSTQCENCYGRFRSILAVLPEVKSTP